VKAIILARGFGTRMQASDPSASLTEEQLRAADAGRKAMMPLAFGRPFLDWVMSALSDAGVREVCLVIAPGHVQLQKYYSRLTLTRVRISFAIQEEARGTADAVLAAEPFAEGKPFLVLNADNYYPVDAISALIALGGPGLAAFDRDALLQHGNVDPERIRRYAILDVDEGGTLRRIVEKPDPATMAAWENGHYVSMNLWALPPEIFVACRAIPPSSRGEVELPAAVQYAIDKLGVTFKATIIRNEAAAVLDLTSRADVASVTERLGKRRPVL
jgi:dTDP-glucose pyrophosphorylase